MCYDFDTCLVGMYLINRELKITQFTVNQYNNHFVFCSFTPFK